MQEEHFETGQSPDAGVCASVYAAEVTLARHTDPIVGIQKIPVEAPGEVASPCIRVPIIEDHRSQVELIFGGLAHGFDGLCSGRVRRILAERKTCLSQEKEHDKRDRSFHSANTLYALLRNGVERLRDLQKRYTHTTQETRRIAT
jgi:hypothetical protein